MGWLWELQTLASGTVGVMPLQYHEQSTTCVGLTCLKRLGITYFLNCGYTSSQLLGEEENTHYWIRGLKRNATNTSYTSSYPPILETTDSEWNSRTMFCGTSLVPSRAGERCKCANSQTMSNICPCHTLKVESLSYRQMLQKFVRHQT